MSTCDGSRLPELQADPVEVAIPLRSRATTRDWPSTPLKLRLVVVGRRGAVAPFDYHVGDRGLNPLLETVAQRRNAGHLIGHVCGCKLSRNPKPDDSGDMLCPTSEATLLWATGHDGVKGNPPPHIERSNPFGAMQSCGPRGPGDRHQGHRPVSGSCLRSAPHRYGPGSPGYAPVPHTSEWIEWCLLRCWRASVSRVACRR